MIPEEIAMRMITVTHPIMCRVGEYSLQSVSAVKPGHKKEIMPTGIPVTFCLEDLINFEDADSIHIRDNRFHNP